MRPAFPAHVSLLLLLLGSASCISTPPRGGIYRVSGEPRSDCSHSVQLLQAAQLLPAHHELARLSATCPYLSPITCELELLSRGCELGADAIVITATRTIGKSEKPQLADEALAIRFESSAATSGRLQELAALSSRAWIAVPTVKSARG